MSVPLVRNNDTEFLDEVALREYIAHRLKGKAVSTVEDFQKAVLGNGADLEFASQRQSKEHITHYIVMGNGKSIEVGVECDTCQGFYQPETLLKNNGSAYCPKCKIPLYDVNLKVS
jgi:hypothetical protein